MKVRMPLIGAVVLALGIAAPVAQAERPDDREGPRGPGAVAAAVTQGAASSHPDNRAGVRGVGAQVAVVEPALLHPDNRAEARGPGALTSVVPQPSSSGFDWGDALIGSIGGAGMALLLTGCFVLLASQRSKARMA